MKNLILTLSIVCLTYSMVSAQSNRTQHPTTQKTYKMVFQVQKNQSLRLVSFADTKKGPVQAYFTSPGDVPGLKLPPGARVEGYFKFSSFASAGGLGSTRVYSGNGKGTLKILKMVDHKGNKISSRRSSVGNIALRLR